MWKIITNFTRLEKILVFFLVGIVLFTSLNLTWVFYQENTSVLPAEGGVYAEGVVGEFKLLNPLFAKQNPVDVDIVKLVFSGLMKYDSDKNQIVDDIATHTLSADQKTYTFTIKENAYFHDGNKVTANDVYFTFHDIIQNPEFKNELLRREFEGIEINKIDNQTITFTLPKPYKFFLTNLTIGILPRHLLFDLPIKNLDQSTFNQNPIGSGPFKFNQIIVNSNSVDINLKRFENYYGQKPALDGMVIKTYKDYQTLIKNLDILNGVKSIPKEAIDTFPTQNRFEVKEYHLPQYVALFLNNDSKILKTPKVRLALQLATNREKIANDFGETMIIDDPLMEIDQKNWIYQYDKESAAGGLYDAGWNLPNKIQDGEDDEQIEKNKVEESAEDPKTSYFFPGVFSIPQAKADENYITSPNGGEDYTTSEASFYINGIAPAGTQAITVNGYTLSKFEAGDSDWTYKASTEIGTLKEGENLYEIYATDESGIKKKLDEMKIVYVKSEEPVEEKKEEEVVVVAETPSVTEETPELVEVAELESVVEEVTPETESGTVVEEEVVEPKPEPVVSKTNSNIRQNEAGKKLTLRLVTSSRPGFYKEIAEEVKEQWMEVGVDVSIEVLEMEEFQQKILLRDYDVLLYGQSLGYNLDTYPYWHSSQVGEKGLNLANYASFESDSLMEDIRMTHNEERRTTALKKLKESMSRDLPAIFLYRPVYYMAYDKRLKDMNFNNLPTISDRFANVEKWHLKEDRFFKNNVDWSKFFSWIKDKAWKVSW